MSVDDLVKKEIQRQVDTSIEEIPHEVSLWNTPDKKVFNTRTYQISCWAMNMDI